MSWEIIFEHTLPLGAIVAIVIAAVLLGLLTCWRWLPREWTAWAVLCLRLLFIGLFAWCLLMPVLKHTLTEQLKPRFLVALDISASMNLTPADDIPARWKTAQAVLQMPWIKIIGDQCDIDCYPVAGELGAKVPLADALKLAPDGKSTSLRTALRKLTERYKGQNIAGLLLLSDGLDTHEAGDEWASGDWPFPIYNVRPEPPGVWKVEPDARVDAVDTPRRVIVGWETELKAIVSGQGTRGAAVDIQLLENDKLVQELPLELPDEGGSREATFRLSHGATGSFTYTVRIPPIAGETHTNDNAFAVNVQVVDTRNRLLYVEGVPRWESKYMVRLLKGCKEIAPVCFVRGPGGRFLSYGTKSTTAPEMTESQLLNFKIVMVGDLDADELGQERARALAKFVESGGSLVLLGGPKAWGPKGFNETPLSAVTPVTWQSKPPLQEDRIEVALTAEGRAHPAFQTDGKTAWEKVPPILSFFPGAMLKPGAASLLNTGDQSGNQPVIVAQKYGHGKVVAILTDSLWRWQLNPGKDNAYQRFWMQLLLWLSPTESELATYQVEVLTDSDQIFIGEPIELHARVGGLENAPPKAISVTGEVTGPDGRRLPFPMTRQDASTSSGKKIPGFGTAMTPPVPGLYTVLAAAQIDGKRYESGPYSFFVKPFTPESNPRPANVTLLMALAKASRGQFCEPEQISEVLEGITIKTTEEERVTYQSLWNSIPIIACLLALLALEWTIRKIKNMA